MPAVRGVHEEEEKMKLMRLAMCVAAFAVLGKIAMSEDIDVRALQAKIQAQEQRLNDLNAKLGASKVVVGENEGLVSINKNAVVTIGGTVNTRYYYYNGKISDDNGVVTIPAGSVIPPVAVLLPNGVPAANTDLRASEGNLKISDAKLTVQIDVNDYFDAFLKVDLQSSTDGSGSDNAEVYYVRWKNVCNTGFGLKVGRDALVFGEGGYGVLGAWAANGDGVGDIDWGDITDGVVYYARPAHNNWDIGRITQITPYWEGLDGKVGFELSVFQRPGANGGNHYYDVQDGKFKTENYGTSASARLRFTPIEGLDLSLSAVNFGSNNSDADNNTAVDVSAKWRPAAFNRLLVWAQYIHGWNAAFVDGLNAGTVNLGAAFDINESFTVFAQGDYLYGSGYEGTSPVAGLLPGYDHDRARGWAAYAGVQYKLPYGVLAELGYKYENVKWSDSAANASNIKVRGHTAYAHLGFDF